MTDQWGDQPAHDQPSQDQPTQPLGWGPPRPWGPPPQDQPPAWGEPWAPPTQQWGPVGPPVPPRGGGGGWVVPLVVVLAVALVAVGGVALFRGGRTVESARPAVTATARVPAPRPKGTAKAKPVPAKPARTYSAPPDGIPVRGRVVDTAGRPVPDAAVKISQHEGFFEGFTRALLAITTLGFACLADVCTVPYNEGRTDGSGNYTVFLKHAPDDYEVSVATPQARMYGGDFDFTGAATRLPEIVLWAPVPRVNVSGTTARVDFRRPPSRAGVAKGYDIDVEGEDVFDDLVEIEDAHPGSTFDVRVLEDSTATVRVDVTVRTARFGDVHYVGETTARGHTVPMSRGKDCLEYSAPNARAVRTPACGLTDGTFHGYWDHQLKDVDCRTANCRRAVAVDLGAVRPLHYVLVRGCDSYDSELQTSRDGVHWRTVARACSAKLSGSARYVRVVGPGGGFYGSYKEFSVF